MWRVLLVGFLCVHLAWWVGIIVTAEAASGRRQGRATSRYGGPRPKVEASLATNC